MVEMIAKYGVDMEVSLAYCTLIFKNHFDFMFKMKISGTLCWTFKRKRGRPRKAFAGNSSVWVSWSWQDNPAQAYFRDQACQ